MCTDSLKDRKKVMTLISDHFMQSNKACWFYPRNYYSPSFSFHELEILKSTNREFLGHYWGYHLNKYEQNANCFQTFNNIMTL